MGERVRVGTRGSPLALVQAEAVAAALRAAWPELVVELVPIRTSGDRLMTAHLADVGGKGLFVREIDEALLARRVDVAVHSLKDLPVERPAGLGPAAYPRRADPRDVLVTRSGLDLDGLVRGARVGTSSPRRRVQLLARRPDLRVEAIRGNVETRLRKLDEDPYDAVVLAAAGLARLGLDPSGRRLLEPEEMLPAVGQGTLAVEARIDDVKVRGWLAALDDAATRQATLAEREFLGAMGGTCTTPLAAHARRLAGGLRLDAFVATPDGSRSLRDGMVGDQTTSAALGRELAKRMLASGAGEILRAGRAA